jgi:hypothetical protein
LFKLKAIVSTQENYPWIWNAQENCSLSCELWVGTNDFNTKKNVLAVPIHGNFPEWKLAESVM